ncbi:hypothetical protein ACIBPB_27585 [Micromonospora sp. NPDC049836]|uniref:hypothetical protein n=1 Tax=Micromonospora sp. NPDC049836 TaxID=3364274 RepID=UPI00378A6599
MPITAVARRRRGVAVAACLLLLPVLSACFDQERGGTMRPGRFPASTMSPPAAEGILAGTPTPTPTRATVVSPSTSATPIVAAQRVPVIRSLVATPDRVDPRSCTPPDPPERPEVVVRLEKPGPDLAAIVVTLSYEVSATDYQGEVRMRYDPDRKVFTHRLPPVTRTAVGERADGIWLSAQAENRSIRPNWVPPPTRGWIAIAGVCTVIGN